MRCENCPAFWYILDYETQTEALWGCQIQPEKGTECGRMFSDGNIGCNRKLKNIQNAIEHIKNKQ